MCSKVAESPRGIGVCCLFADHGLGLFRPASEVLCAAFGFACGLLRTSVTFNDLGVSTGQSRLSFARRHGDLMMAPGAEAVYLVFISSLSSEERCADCPRHCKFCSV